MGAALLVALGFWEAYADLKYPMLPPKLFKNVHGFTVILVVCFVGGMLYYSMNVLWPRQSGLLFVPAGKPIIAGVYANMVSFGTILAGLVIIFFSQRVGHERWQQVGFMVGCVIGPSRKIELIASTDSANSIDRLISQRWPERSCAGDRHHHRSRDEYHTAPVAGFCHDIRGYR